MRDTAPKDLLGYVVVHLPDAQSWQGFFVVPQMAAAGRNMLANVRGANAAAPGPTETRHGIPGVAEADQPLVGSLALVAAELYGRGIPPNRPVGEQAKALLRALGAATWALVEVTGRKWLLVTARRPGGGGGYATTVQFFDAADLDEARQLIAAEVSRAKVSLGMASEFERALRGLQEGRRGLQG